MNGQAHSLGLGGTRYADASGADPATVRPRPLAHAITAGQPVAQATVTIGAEVRHITLDASQAAAGPSVGWLLTRL